MKLSIKTAQRLMKKYGSWVLITGATSGIGRELAVKFAEAGFNLVITGRREALLQELCTELFEFHRAEIIPVSGDLSRREDVELLLRETAHLSPGIAVLNAGFGTSGNFLDSDLESELNMLDLNCRAVLLLTHGLARRLKAASQPGAIVLMSSMVAFQGVPQAAHYAATKAWVQSLGEGLRPELNAAGIDLLIAAPGPVESGFAARANMKMSLSLRPEAVGVPIISAIGRRSTLLPGFLTKLLVYNLRMVPRWAKIRIMGKVMGGFTRHQGTA
ncbi:MAG: SDR family NAD(P)-dependent oxidoreductase [Bacteroidia bacterium]|nr:SDR family NAD(P)-dependent oxidoreductase [Bacteroidia bacterium]